MALQAPPQADLLALFELPDAEDLQGLGAYLGRTLETCADWFHATGATLFLRKGDSEEYELVARAGAEAKAPLGALIREGQGIAGTAIAKQEPMLLQDPHENASLEGKLLSNRPDIGSSLIVPLTTKALGSLGVLCLSRSKGEQDFSRRDLKIARALAAQIALAVANARLIGQLSEAAETRRLAEIGRMTAAIAHEIRNPLTGIRGAAQVVSDSECESAELGRIIVEETDKLDRLCSEFLAFARPFQLRRELLKLSEVVAPVVERMRPEFDAKGISITLDFSSHEPTIDVDPMRIEQVCRNLAQNALHATLKGGRVEFRIGEGWLEIEDDGEGMSELEMQSLFTPFFTTKARGTGLGMSVVKKIVEAHGGCIRIQSEKGQGTRVRISFLHTEEGID
jgi:signal transduction histidine kinase